MVLWQIGGIVGVYGLLSTLFIFAFKPYKKQKMILITLLTTLALFCIGFIFRLSSTSTLVDFGYFLTEISYVTLTALFVGFLGLGQIKYWGLST